MVKRITQAVLIFFLLVFAFSLVTFPVYSDSISDLENQINQKNQEIQKKEDLLKDIAGEIDAINKSSATVAQKAVLIDKEIAKIDDYISDYTKILNAKEKELKEKSKNIESKLVVIRGLSTQLYKRSFVSGINSIILSISNGESLNQIMLNQLTLSKLSREMRTLSQAYAEIKSEKMQLDSDKNDLIKQKQALAKIKNDLLSQKSSLISQANSKAALRKSVSGQIGLLKDQISDLQAAILIAKSGSANTSVEDMTVNCGSNNVCINASRTGFLQRAPSGYFAVFSIGAYTHRNGMSQYGALARANSGQNYKAILKKYYGKSPVSRSTGGKIPVKVDSNTVRLMDFETKYLYGIAEMPSDWPLEAQKAQAIAARTYAYNTYYQYHQGNTGVSICISEGCQVWNSNKSANVPALWKQAVDSTKGMILSGVSTQYSAVTGGFLNTSGWDTTDGSGGSGSWMSKSWEFKTGVSWFYKSWYTRGYINTTGETCGRNPWLSPSEMVDILNTYLVMKGIGLKGSVDSRKILPITINSCNYGDGGTPYSMSEMSNLLSNPVRSLTSDKPVVRNNTSGQTIDVSIKTVERGWITMSGADFKQVFNTRAPGYLSVPQSGFVFINVERK